MVRALVYRTSETSYVGIVNCWFSSLLWRIFSESSGFPLSTTTNSQFRTENSEKKKKNIECLAIAILNIITIVVFVKNKRQLQRRSTYLIIHLAIVDLLVGVVSGPLQIEHSMATFCNLWKYSRERIWSDYLIVGFVNSFSSTSLVHLGTAFWTTGFIRRW